MFACTSFTQAEAVIVYSERVFTLLSLPLNEPPIHFDVMNVCFGCIINFSLHKIIVYV